MSDYQNESFGKKNAVWLVVVAGLVIFGFLLFKGWDKVVNQEIDGKMETITGSFICLPLKVPIEVEEELEDCVLGVRSRDGFYYALDVSKIQDANSDLRVEDTIAVTGFIKPETEIQSSQWEAFSI